MGYTIDTLMYESRGLTGGVPFVAPYGAMKEVSLFRMRNTVARADGLRVTYDDGNITNIASTHHTVIQKEDMKAHIKDNINMYYLTSNQTDKKMDNEPCFGGFYGMFFYKRGTNTSYDKVLDQCVKDGLNVTEYVVPNGFRIAGFHGMYGARLDRVGVFLELDY